MSTNLEQQIQIDRRKIKDAINLQLPVEITTYTLPRNMEVYIRRILQVFLEECHQEHMYEYLNFCLGELMTNSKKANTKRVYFKDKKLDINNPEDYEKGMKTFKDDMLNHLSYYLQLQRKAGLYIKLCFHMYDGKIKIEIKNNSKLTVFERERINAKLNSAQQYNDIQEVLTKVLDQTEGAGLGIIIIILMLQKIGLSKENYQVISTDTETITRIILPCNQQVQSGVETLSYEYIAMQEQFPVLGENLNKANALVSAENVDRTALLKLLRTDPTLSLSLLVEAFKKGTENIALGNCLSLFTDTELKQLFSDKNPAYSIVEDSQRNRDLWLHAKRSAFFAYNFAKNYPINTEIFTPDEIYTMGLINILGIILLQNGLPEQKQYINDLSEQYDLTDKVRAVFYGGNGYTYLNYLYARKFNFPKKVCYTVASWNNMGSLKIADVPDEEYNSFANIIYIAELTQYFLEKKIEFYQIDKKRIEKFGIKSEEQMNYVANQLNVKINA